VCPGDQILAHEHELEPDRVGRERAERQVTQPAVLGAADRVLDAGALAVDLLEPRDPPAGLSGDEDLKAVPVVIAKRELRARVGRSRRQIARVPAGQAERSSPASSATWS
jgi:hypothetical protein